LMQLLIGTSMSRYAPPIGTYDARGAKSNTI
jgi:hypothetical protein